ncbi:hypothetical protein NEPAR06_0031 [Nematocida parisii]|uniref:ABC transporter domain-containing protein n=1 Tax=Nematocida parisii (strain ERTm3) TaxID=935791 RepID=I3EDZ3_NEMP3|nr:uncharacterized protein NEPG_00042 [Nematocida parisii ERTm1]EIJ87440.1 hypothetical protein NEQG_02321 [Nematocida parisii ERTm3]KAI5142721.1 hypothetical protein NEPAR07_0247 [Nematocida parisii]EIJ94520.1 hypothetical protein NEPG_00042 [Nematocida parisii ERTm1]KAI5152910.1 hypothetical protein NEPAR06_0031 [Nematocida parisii]KAI5157433.1 hypothetical protein NEPAR05_1272 [Nematocida parisii]|eukprot:XP_013057876.1 hypothetical protein NEPG_00042 [Nematocida parisii ERTm1]
MCADLNKNHKHPNMARNVDGGVRDSPINGPLYMQDADNLSHILIQFKEYKRTTLDGNILLDNISLFIPENKLIAVIGPNNNEKSYMLESIAGMCTPSDITHSNVYVRDRTSNTLIIRRSKNWLHRVNYILSDITRNTSNAISVFNSLLFLAKCHGKTEYDVNEYLSMTGLIQSKDLLLNEMTDEEKQKFLFIHGMLGLNEVNVWDGVLSGINLETDINIISAIKLTNCSNIVRVDRVSQEVLNVFDYVIIMYKTSIIYFGSPLQVQNYFTEGGVCFPVEKYSIEYLIEVLQNKYHNSISNENILVINNICIRNNEAANNDQIDKAPVKHRNTLFLWSQVKVSFPRCKEVIRNIILTPVNMDAYAYISGIVIAMFAVYFVWGYMCLFKLYSKVTENMNDSIYKYTAGSSSLQFPNIFRLIKQKLLEKNSDDTEFIEIITDMHRVSANHGFISILTYLFYFLFIFGGCIQCIGCPVFYSDIHFYTTRRSQVRSNQFTVAELIIAQMCDVLLCRALPFFILTVLAYFSVYWCIDSNLVNASTIGHALPITILFMCCSLIALHGTILQFLLTSFKKYVCITVLYQIVVNVIPLLVIYLFKAPNETLQLDYFSCALLIFKSTSLMDTLSSVSNYYSPGWTCTFMWGLSYACLYIMKIVIQIVSPVLQFSHVLEHILLYTNKFTVRPETANSVSEAHLKMLKTEILALIIPNNTSSGNKLDPEYKEYLISRYADFSQFNAHTAQILGKTTPHEPFEISSISLKNMSLLYLVWSTLRAWIFAILVFSISIVFAYKYFLPKSRG